MISYPQNLHNDSVISWDCEIAFAYLLYKIWMIKHTQTWLSKLYVSNDHVLFMFAMIQLDSKERSSIVCYWQHNQYEGFGKGGGGNCWHECTVKGQLCLRLKQYHRFTQPFGKTNQSGCASTRNVCSLPRSLNLVKYRQSSWPVDIFI